MSTAGTESPDASRKPIVNFSRPRFLSKGEEARPDESQTQSNGYDSNVKSINAFHSKSSSDSPYPDEPRFSTDSETISNTSFNAQRGDAAAAARRGGDGEPINLRDQRHPGHIRMNTSNTATSSNSNGSSNNSNNTATSRPSTADSMKKLMPKKSILKQTSVEVSSERADSEMGEDDRSHHTMSDNGTGSGGSSSATGTENGGKWSSSNFDTSEMSQREVEKLEKKGKNPSLVAEMKAARKGKGIVSVMTGTAYVS